MGCPAGPPTFERVLRQHIHMMKVYAEELDAQGPLIKRREVVDRILKCASEVEDAIKRIEESKRK